MFKSDSVDRMEELFAQSDERVLMAQKVLADLCQHRVHRTRRPLLSYRGSESCSLRAAPPIADTKQKAPRDISNHCAPRPPLCRCSSQQRRQAGASHSASMPRCAALWLRQRNTVAFPSLLAVNLPVLRPLH